MRVDFRKAAERLRRCVAAFPLSVSASRRLQVSPHPTAPPPTTDPSTLTTADCDAYAVVGGHFLLHTSFAFVCLLRCTPASTRFVPGPDNTRTEEEGPHMPVFTSAVRLRGMSVVDPCLHALSAARSSVPSRTYAEAGKMHYAYARRSRRFHVMLARLTYADVGAVSSNVYHRVLRCCILPHAGR